MKPKDVGDNKRVYIDEHNEKDSRFKVGDRIRISKFKYIYLLKDMLLIGVKIYLLLIK